MLLYLDPRLVAPAITPSIPLVDPHSSIGTVEMDTAIVFTPPPSTPVTRARKTSDLLTVTTRPTHSGRNEDALRCQEIEEAPQG
jgi:hypothetical protein